MEAVFECPGCQTVLRAPAGESGHRAKCPACGRQFLIPSVNELMEDAASLWIGQGVDEVLSHRHEESEQKILRSLHQQAAAEAEAKAKEKARQPEAAGSAKDGPALSPRLRRHRAVDREQHLAPSAPPRRSDANLTPASATPATAKTSPRSPGAPPAPEGEYPQEIKPSRHRPYLVVRSCDAAGVRFAFDARHLRNEAFRSSMPARCAFTGSSDRNKLMARPLVFADRSRQGRSIIETLTQKHEERSIGDRSNWELMHAIGELETIAHPFNQPVPYFACMNRSHEYLQCETFDRGEGRITCEVLIPDSTFALEWLMRVNGICGPEYALLSRDVALRHGDAWKQLDETCRQRLGGWCRLQAGESFRHYFNDADFGKHDGGLAGLVLTDQRLLFCKYHHRGQVRIDDGSATVIAREEGGMINLTLRIGAERSRMIKLRQSDLPTFVRAMGKTKLSLEGIDVEQLKAK